MNYLTYKFLTAALLTGLAVAARPVAAQDKGLVNTSTSKYAKLSGVDLSSVQWQPGGFWADRFQVLRESMIPTMWALYHDPVRNHAFRNFEIAAGLQKGEHKGPPFHDGDFYKLLEAVAATYATTHDPKLDQMMDEAIQVIAKCQRPDGYLNTQATIAALNTGKSTAFQDRLNFESYNLGHLMTAACVHYRATGKTTMLDLAKKATDYLYSFYKRSSPELARNAICPSHYMGVVEMYRTTHDPRYLELAQQLINIRGLAGDIGTDDNQDRLPFRQMQKAGGHAVRANYLFAGVADVYAETGDATLLTTLNKMWDDVTSRKMYVTGACGALYDGVSPDGTAYKPDTVQKIHQAYGRAYQLPNHTAHGETCANIGNVLWNWRMLQLTGEAKYADVLETALYNSVLSGISLDGKKFLYTNPLAYSDALPFQQRWSKDRVDYISLSNCCPPNVVRTVAEVGNYAYSVSEKGLWLNLYGANNLSTKLKNGVGIKLQQTTNYPWDGAVQLTVQEATATVFSVFLRIPGWAEGAKVLVNGKAQSVALTPGTYAEINRAWKSGDKVELTLPMPAQLVEANPLVEETRNQVAVKRGPIVYCLETKDFPAGQPLSALTIPATIKLTPKPLIIEGSQVMSLTGKGELAAEPQWNGQLYRPVSARRPTIVPLTLVPYYAWGNRGHADMEVWIPLSR
ncbi:aceric acid hydrolase [Hymenobacter cellulosivorans]|uniref:Glycoside hydrolase family 127 protein n=1 Tax=Hymenobacter cellulosivorans TaxID=2932249 RepID=A0ABY4F394_9BACT|nr:glycoside hydrolase family 127 protein [Hymenobacter cellulosivorans]UOQ51126.1 glycoside hydrolase family 127 protein [Hymenobacter cellulosivorans]